MIEDHTLAATLAEYLGERRRLCIAEANAAARAAGLAPVVSAEHRDHALAAVLAMLKRDHPAAYEDARRVVVRIGGANASNVV